MGIEVVAAGEGEPTADEVAEKIGPSSPLALLRGKRAELEAQLFLDLAVPRWDSLLPGRKLWVRYRPANPGLFSASLTRRERAHDEDVKKGGRGDPRRATKANADILVAACVAVFDLPDDEKPPEELPPNLPTFASRELSEALGATGNAVDTCLKLYATDGDVLVAATQLMDWSGLASQEAGKGFLDD